MTSEAFETQLSGDDAMAFNFLSRAANAIVSASDLSRKLDAVSMNLSHANDALSILEDIKRTQEERIATLEAHVESLRNSEQDMRGQRDTWRDMADQRQRDVDLLDATVADLRSELSATKSERDDYGLKHLESVEALQSTQAKLDTIVGAMEKVGFKVSTILPREEPSHADYAEAHPEYRAEVEYDYSGEPLPEDQTPRDPPESFRENPPSEGGLVGVDYPTSLEYATED